MRIAVAATVVITEVLRLSSVFHCAFVLFVSYVTIYSLFFDKARRKSPEAYRRARQFRSSEKAAERFERIPPIVRVINEEKRWKKARRSAYHAVLWALTAKDFQRDEISGAVILAIRRDRNIVWDHDGLYNASLAILNKATNQ